MMTSSNGNIFHITGHLWGEFTGHRWIPLTKASDAVLWCFLWSAPEENCWVNNHEAGDLRCHRAHYDVIVMKIIACHMALYEEAESNMCYVSCVGFFDGLVQERRNSSALAMELRFSCTNPAKCTTLLQEFCTWFVLCCVMLCYVPGPFYTYHLELHHCIA